MGHDGDNLQDGDNVAVPGSAPVPGERSLLYGDEEESGAGRDGIVPNATVDEDGLRLVDRGSP
jgi:hypothetical protein